MYGLAPAPLPFLLRETLREAENMARHREGKALGQWKIALLGHHSPPFQYLVTDVDFTGQTSEHDPHKVE